MKTHYISVTGGVVSSLGKGVAMAALAALLKARGFSVRLMKFDPYLNFDAGTMNPYQHGEVFVTDDGGETDMDLGHYERFTGDPTTRDDCITMGRIFSEVSARERRGNYTGGTVQVIPHITDHIKHYVLKHDGKVDFVLCEIGGTVGDIESLPFLEAMRQLRLTVGLRQFLSLHLTFLPEVGPTGELKTKPTQHSAREMLSHGIAPDILLCRHAGREIPDEAICKIAMFANLDTSCVIPAPNVEDIYRLPLVYHRNGLDTEVCRFFDLSSPAPDLMPWEEIAKHRNDSRDEVRVALVGKYTGLRECYKSVAESLMHGGLANNVRVNLKWVEAELLERDGSISHLKDQHGIIVPGGFGQRGSEGMIAAIRFAREARIPFFGICFGMQLAVVEAARNLIGLNNASSTEFGLCPEPVVGLLTEWKIGDKTVRRTASDVLGGTMRLGAYTAVLDTSSLVAKIYGGSNQISERHRHRYEINIDYRDRLENAGIRFTGLSPDGQLPECLEIPSHPWFIGVQFHPELKSKPFAPHPLFAGFIGSAHRYAQATLNG